MHENVEVGDMVFVAEGQEGVGAVRGVHKDKLVVFIENAGEFDIPGTAIVRVHDRKVIVDPARLPRQLLTAIGHAHDSEDPKLVG